MLLKIRFKYPTYLFQASWEGCSKCTQDLKHSHEGVGNSCSSEEAGRQCDPESIHLLLSRP